MIATERASESQHWYTQQGAPMYTVTGKNGKERNTTLRDARTMDLVPSVTSILNVAAKPALNIWIQRQVLLAALTLPRLPDEAEDVYLERIISDSKAQGRAAADEGTAIHESIQKFYENKPHNHPVHVEHCNRAIVNRFGEQKWISEASFAHKLGFGGKVDMFCDGVVIDIKTKEFDDASKVMAYDEHLMQLAAYRIGLGLLSAVCANVFVSRNVPSLCVVHVWSEDELQRGWQMFQNLLAFWKLKNKFEAAHD